MDQQTMGYLSINLSFYLSIDLSIYVPGFMVSPCDLSPSTSIIASENSNSKLLISFILI